jgi:DDE family transposase
LLCATVAAGRDGGLIPDKPRAAVDSTGSEARAVSRYFVTRAGRRGRQKRWPKRTAVLDARSHLFLSARVTRGPSPDAPHLVPAVRDAVENYPLDTLLADAGYNWEDNHAVTRERFGVRSTVIALNRRGSRKRPKTEYRRQMVRRFRTRPKGSRSKRVYGQRWQIESGFSRNKRLLGSALRASAWVNQKGELLLKVITHNLMLLAAP